MKIIRINEECSRLKVSPEALCESARQLGTEAELVVDPSQDVILSFTREEITRLKALTSQRIALARIAQEMSMNEGQIYSVLKKMMLDGKIDGTISGGISPEFIPKGSFRKGSPRTREQRTRLIVEQPEGYGTTLPPIGTHRYDDDATVWINAIPGEGWAFSHWRIDSFIEQDAKVHLRMNQDRVIQAIFTKRFESIQSSSQSDPYSILGVRRGASWEEIEDAYKTECQKWHPDKLQGGTDAQKKMIEDKMKDINAAYQSLKDQLRI